MEICEIAVTGFLGKLEMEINKMMMGGENRLSNEVQSSIRSLKNHFPMMLTRIRISHLPEKRYQ
jgi:hypothetical protein